MNEAFQYIFPGTMLMWVFFIAQGAVADIYGEYKHQTMQRLIVSRVTIAQFLWAKILHCVLLCLIVELILVIVTRLLFGLHWGNWFLLLLVLLIINISITGLLILVYGLCRNKNIGDAVLPALIIISAILGGAMFPYEQMPPSMQMMGNLTITRWGIRSISHIMQSHPVNEIMLPLLMLLTIGIVCAAAGARLFRKRFEMGGME